MPESIKTKSRPLTWWLIAMLALASSAAADQVRTFGDGAGDGELTEIAAIVEDPDAWAGKEVRVRGRVTGVCQKKGCWMQLTDAGHTLRVKVEDDVIVFPPEAEGRAATARGTVTLRDMSREQYQAWLEHLAEERGETFDPRSLGEPPYRLVQLAGIGAELDSLGEAGH